MECQIRRADDVAELFLVGSLDSSWTAYLGEQIDEVVRAGAREVWFDMLGVTYLSSHGIAMIIRYHQQLRGVGGRVRIVAGSALVNSVLKLSGLAQVLDEEGSVSARREGTAAAFRAVELGGMTLQVFPAAGEGGQAKLRLMGDPTRLPGRGYEPADERTWTAEPGLVALGLGALGPGFEECRGRFGEFLAVSGFAAYRPSEGQGRPDFERAVGEFVPTVRVLYGMGFSTARADVIRFESSGEPGGAGIPLSRLVMACLDQTNGDAVGIVLVAETDGLVGAAITRSPVGLLGGVDPFAHPDVRDWFSFTPEPEYSGSMAIVVGLAARQVGSELGAFVRPLVGQVGSGNGVSDRVVPLGHFHAGVLPYRPLSAGAIGLDDTVADLFEPGRVETILHLLGDARPIVGAGESTFKRGAIWCVPLLVEGGW